LKFYVDLDGRKKFQLCQKIFFWEELKKIWDFFEFSIFQDVEISNSEISKIIFFEFENLEIWKIFQFVFSDFHFFQN